MKTCYYMSVGEKTYYYTLNATYVHTSYIPYGDEGQYEEHKEIRHHFIRNLSHDFETAKEKAIAWVAEHGCKEKPLKLLDTPYSMNARQEGILEAIREMIAEGKMPSGKYAGVHISEVPMSYIHWAICNLYHPDVIETQNGRLGLMCYDYAQKQGWIDAWVKEGSGDLNDPEYQKELDETIAAGVILCGKHEGVAIKDMIYTKKGTIKVASLNYLNWLATSKMSLDYLVSDSTDIPYVKDEDGNRIYHITTEHMAERGQLKKLNRFELSILVARQYLYDNKMNDRRVRMYKIHWNEVEVREDRAISNVRIPRD